MINKLYIYIWIFNIKVNESMSKDSQNLKSSKNLNLRSSLFLVLTIIFICLFWILTTNLKKNLYGIFKLRVVFRSFRCDLFVVFSDFFTFDLNVFKHLLNNFRGKEAYHRLRSIRHLWIGIYNMYIPRLFLIDILEVVVTSNNDCSYMARTSLWYFITMI